MWRSARRTSWSSAILPDRQRYHQQVICAILCLVPRRWHSCQTGGTSSKRSRVLLPAQSKIGVEVNSAKCELCFINHGPAEIASTKKNRVYEAKQTFIISLA
ncbi:hypothetical protein Ciccas_013010 [Cichlidogyrus casuarinus]|uniref:Uncharacterized protein n=1 Tax=Cichlidogyrus casuarinus TaxID=1844966 RepID=A0ABD2PLU6_9PLAT